MSMSEPFNYPMMVPPEPFKSFEAMSSEEAIRFFDWYVGQQEGRVAILRQAYLATGGSNDLDCSRDSFMTLWEWFAPFVRVEETGTCLPEKLVKAGVSNGSLAPSTLSLAVDVGFYLASSLQRASPQVQWALWTKSRDYYFQRPVLVGFGRYPLVPHDPVVAGCWRAARAQSKPTELARIYDMWASRVDK